MKTGILSTVIVLSCAAVPLCCVGCGTEADVPIPLPDLEQVEPPIRAAVREAREAVRRSPRSARAWGALADRFFAHRWYREAGESYAHAARLDPDEFEWTYRLGHTLAHRSDNAAAETAFAAALGLRADYGPAWVMRALMRSRLGRLEEAREDYARALELDPRNCHALLGLAQLDIRAGEWSRARRNLQVALRINPRHAEVHQALAQVSLGMGDEARAALHTERTRELSKTTPLEDPLGKVRVAPVGSIALNDLGLRLERQGRMAEAEQTFRIALRINPGYTEARFNLGTVLARQGQLEEALELLTAVVGVRPNHPEARVNLALALMRADRAAEARSHLERALETNEEHPRAHAALARCWWPDRPAESVAHLRRAIRLDPNLYEAQRMLAWIRATARDAALRDGPEALRLARRANGVTGNGHPLVLDTLAAAFAEIGRFDQAVETSERAIRAALAGGRPDLEAKLRERLAHYQLREPYRE